MTSRLLVFSLVLLLAGCSSENDSSGTDNTDEVQLVDGQVVCDSCASVRIVLSGPGTANVREATLVTSGTARTPVPARVVLARESGATGEVLVVNVYFDSGIDEGEFDLWLDPVNGDPSARVVPGALRVTRARPGPGELATVRVWVQLAGVDRDGRFVLRTVDGCQAACGPVTVEAYEAAVLELQPGAYTFRLDDVASNCTVGGAPNPSTVTLERGRVTALSYQVTCVQSTTPAWVRVANVTTGVDRDDEYLVSCSPFTCLPFKLAANRDTVIRTVPGEVGISLGELAPNCTLSGAAAAAVTATAGDTAVVGFAIDCRATPGIRVTVRTTGRDIDPDFLVSVCDAADIFYSCSSRRTSSSSVASFPGLQPGHYSVRLYEVAENCAITGLPPGDVEVLAGAVEVTIDVTCRAYGTVRVSAVTTGTNQDLSYQVAAYATCDYYFNYCDLLTLPASGSVDLRLPPTTQLIQLSDVASNCAVTAPSATTVSVDVPEDAVVELRFEVVCR